MKIISFSGPYYFLSNFASCAVKDDYGIEYPTTEHAFQAAKTLEPSIRREIAHLSAPGKAKRAGRLIDPIRPDWEEVKVEVMSSFLQQKFSQEPFKSWLLATGDAELIEGNTWGDTFWGMCNGEGQNVLGKLLMQIRKELVLDQSGD